MCSQLAAATQQARSTSKLKQKWATEVLHTHVFIYIIVERWFFGSSNEIGIDDHRTVHNEKKGAKPSPLTR